MATGTWDSTVTGRLRWVCVTDDPKNAPLEPGVHDIDTTRRLTEWLSDRVADNASSCETDQEDVKPRKKVKRWHDESEIDHVGEQVHAEVPVARTTVNLHAWDTVPGTNVMSRRDPEIAIQSLCFKAGFPWRIQQRAAGRVEVTLSPKVTTAADRQLCYVELVVASPSQYDEVRSILHQDRHVNTRGHPAKDTVATDCRLVQTTYGLELQLNLMWKNGASNPRVFNPLFCNTSRPGAVVVRYPPRPVSTWHSEMFYDSAFTPRVDMDVPSSLQSNRTLSVSLYPFQQRTLTWMLRREGALPEDPATTTDAPGCDTWPPPGFREWQDVQGRPMYVNHLTGTISRLPDRVAYPQNFTGGILAEEMGLGKTLEIAALISHNRRGEGVGSFDADLKPTGATLIVAPASLFGQWRDELEKHAPGLTCTEFQGHRRTRDSSDVEDDFTRFDVVLTTYAVLRKEFNVAVDAPDRAMRRRNSANTKTPRPRSPLVMHHWWRVCLDEAQMVDNTTSNVALVAAMIPRQHTWAVSGTPHSKLEDIRAMLVLLGSEPLASSKEDWTLVSQYGHDILKAIIGQIALRHTKAAVRSELAIPQQEKFLITLPLTAIERQNYDTMFDAMCAANGLGLDGSPAHDDWNPKVYTESMRTWLRRLRELCLHPQVGGSNRRALAGRKAETAKTLQEVVALMVTQNQSGILSTRRQIITSYLLRAHIRAFAGDDPKRAWNALPSYERALQLAEDRVAAVLRLIEQDPTATLPDGEGDVKTTAKSGTQSLASELRESRELLHTCHFLVATACYQIRSDTDDEAERARFTIKEAENYEAAKKVRTLILFEATSTVNTLIVNIKSRQADCHLDELPSLWSSIKRSSTSYHLRDDAAKIQSTLDAQAELISQWRIKMIDLLTMPLIDKEDGEETTGEEYDKTAEQQNELYAYHDAYRGVVSDRISCLTGQANVLVLHEMKTLDRAATEGLGHAPTLLLELFAKRRAAMLHKDLHDPKRLHTPPSIRGLLQSVRDDMRERGSAGSTGLSRDLIPEWTHVLEEQNKAMTVLQKDFEPFRETINQRLEYYRQLQKLSDAVSPYKEELDARLDVLALGSAETQHAKYEKTLAALETKQRYLEHLQDESNGKTFDQELCIICRETLQIGVLTACGHRYCQECLDQWHANNKTCPTCKKPLRRTEIHRIAEQPNNATEVGAAVEALESSEQEQATPHASKQPLCAHAYTTMPKETMQNIMSIPLPSSKGSYGSKTDTICRQLLYFRLKDGASKTVIFSQFREYLDILAIALRLAGIRSVRIGQKAQAHGPLLSDGLRTMDAVQAFKTDPKIECFLLDSKSDSSGLNLIVATNVILCEPLVNTATEAQAIARVQRIGQTRDTSVYKYVIEDSVEANVVELGNRRYAQTIERAAADKSHAASLKTDVKPNDSIANGSTAADNDRSRGFSDVAVHVAPGDEELESGQLQKAAMGKSSVDAKLGGELVANNDLWFCLFGRTGST